MDTETRLVVATGKGWRVGEMGEREVKRCTFPVISNGDVMYSTETIINTLLCI